MYLFIYLCMAAVYCMMCVVGCSPKTLENIKLTQIEKFHKAKSDFERESIELDPKKVMQQAVENCKPLLILKKVHRGGVVYQVYILCCDMDTNCKQQYVQ